MSNNRINRRKFLTHSAAAGISITGLASFLSSCGTESPSAPTNASSDAASIAAGDGPSTITIAINQSPWFPSFEEITRIYQEETGNTVNLSVFTFEGVLEKALNAARTKSPEFDIYNLNEGWCATFYDAGFVTPFSEIDSNFKLDDQVIEYDYVTRWDSDKRFFAEQAPIYGVPINGNIQLHFYRKDLFDQLGLQPPTTWDDAIAAAKKIRETNPDIYGYAFRGQKAGFAVTYDFLPLLRGFGGEIFANPPEDWTVILNNDAGKQAINLFKELLSYGPPEPQNIGQAEVIALMQQGKLLQTHLASAAWAPMDDEAASTVATKVHYGVVPKPANGEHTTTSGIWVMSIPVHIADPQKRAAYNFLTWLMTKDAQMKYAQAGGVITREDVYQSELANQEKFRYMQAMSKSTPYIHRGADYTFSPQLLEITEQYLQDIAGGLIDPEEGLDKMASEVTALVEKEKP